MLAHCYRIAKHVVIPMALLAVLVFSTGVAAARSTRHAAHRHKTVAGKSHVTAANTKTKSATTKSATTKSATTKSATTKSNSSKKSSTGGSKGSKGKGKGKGTKTKGTKGKGSKGSTGGSTGGSEGTTGGSEGSTGASEGTTEGATGGSEGSTGDSEGSTGGSEGSTEGATGGSGGSTGGATGGGQWVMPQHLTWYWQIQGAVNNSEPVAAYDIDGFENTSVEVAALHAKGIHVICYMDVGTSENYRSDFSSFPAAVQGSSNGWPGEKWLDVRQLSVLEPIMVKRFEMCKEKGFDAVEPDNMDGYENSTGFPITAAEQATYDEWVANEVHSLGMAVLQKNDGEQTATLEPYFDGALDEQCNQYSECSNFQAYLKAGKPVLNAEYSLAASQFCSADNAAGIMGARYDLELDGKTFEPCWG
jgi:hypothetical protein